MRFFYLWFNGDGNKTNFLTICWSHCQASDILFSIKKASKSKTYQDAAAFFWTSVHTFLHFVLFTNMFLISGSCVCWFELFHTPRYTSLGWASKSLPPAVIIWFSGKWFLWSALLIYFLSVQEQNVASLQARVRECGEVWLTAGALWVRLDRGRLLLLPCSVKNIKPAQ